jgi:hypothetical protein
VSSSTPVSPLSYLRLKALIESNRLTSCVFCEILYCLTLAAETDFLHRVTASLDDMETVDHYCRIRKDCT